MVKNTIYADGLEKVQFNSGNLKLTFVERSDDGKGQVVSDEVITVVLPVESVMRMVSSLSEFINSLIESKNITVKQETEPQE